MRGIVRQSVAAPRANQGRPGEWTEVRRRRRKSLRQEDGAHDRQRQSRGFHYRLRSISNSRYPYENDDQVWNENRALDHFNHGRNRSRCSTVQREFRQQGQVQFHARSSSGFRLSRRRSLSAQGRRQQDYYDGRRVSEFREDHRKVFNGCSNVGRREEKNYVYGHGKEKGEHGNGKILDADQRYVSFYFTNFPPQISIFYLRKGFEVCGILEDVFVARKRNRLGESYGFVKFSNVRDIAKTTKALNAVWFGHYRVIASVANFERNDPGANRRPEKEKAGKSKRTEDALTKDGTQMPNKQAMQAGGEVRTKSAGSKLQNGGIIVSELGPGILDSVRVGDIVVKLGPRQEQVSSIDGQKKGEGQSSNGTNMHTDIVKEQDTRVLLRNYQTMKDDVQWARNGVVATVINGEAIPVVQSRIIDVGFNDLVIIPIGANKVFVRSMAGVDAMTTVSNAKEFFKLIFSNWMRWEKDALPYRRGAWVRLYGVPLHAWNRVLVDGANVEIKIVEEWGYAMGEDTCLFEEENETEESPSEYEERNADMEVCRNVDTLVDKIVDGHEEEEDGAFQVHSNEVLSDKPVDILFVEGEKGGEVGHDQFTGNLGPLGEAGERDLRTGDTPQQLDTQERPLLNNNLGKSGSGAENQRRSNPATSRGLGVWSGYKIGTMGKQEGLGGLEKRKEVRKLVVDLSPFILCLQETKLQTCDDILSCEHVLWCHGRFTKNGEEFFVANVYTPCEDGAKQGLWVSLSARIQSLGRRRICVCGDFNAVKHIDERRSSRGGFCFLDHIPFSRFIEDNNLIDLPLSGHKFTWFKGSGLSISRLDRFLLSGEWCLAWPSCNQVARMRGLCDHCSLVLSTNEEDWGPRPSRMLKCWCDVPGCNLFVRDKWNSLQVEGWGDFVLKEKFKMIKAALRDWHLTHVQNLPSRIESLKTWLSTLDLKGEEVVLSDEEIAELHGVTFDLHSLSQMNASISWQQSRALWLNEGDANSKYFHSILASRRRKNALSFIKVDDVTLEGVTPIRQAVFLHFASHFKATNVERPGVDNLRFKSYKSPGPDSIYFGFIKDFWAELRGDVMRFISEFHRNGKLTKGINSTFIALIPKIDSPQRLNDFWPISLVGSLYKILAKVLANRLRLVIGSIISESQTAFVKDRQILDGILIANEVVDEARKSKKDLMLFKVDFEKAYDSMDWGYLDKVMGRMSFPTLWRKWIKECVCTATASVLVNGSPTDEFPLERGLRQGDPLSPFLFLLAAEGLHVLMEAVVDRHLFEGYRIGERDPVSVSHLLFADDTLLLGVKSWANVRALRAVLVLFETMSGLKVNFSKSMLVGVNIPDSYLGEAASALCCKVGKIPFLYLGLPIGGDPRRLSFWDPMLARLQNRLSGRLFELEETKSWQWQPDPAEGYTVPLKVSIFAWRLLCDRLPTKTNLVTRGILSPAAHSCVSGCGAAESAH
ncbi:hypothetical protein TSUD_411800 [Trifolium subterraneum]|uniref:Reverse transcriptase domain-containing protein n=1 Tax=Trifolium subterraneum TaxID=3900 RepID=A0A2Z6PTR1_TRISU|nr:hypothetical protein TSUD_411800 [Trifolium subterraneum]